MACALLAISLAFADELAMVSPSPIKHGDFTTLAAAYQHRPGYSHLVLHAIQRVMDQETRDIAEIGAGTGKLTQELLRLEPRRIDCVEPNDAMRAEGVRTVSDPRVSWSAGSAEYTGLETARYDWALMGSSFHWTDPNISLPEFHRILRPGGYFTAIWNPRDIEGHPFHEDIERSIREIVPDLKRVSSGSASFIKNMYAILISTGHFEEVLFTEAAHEEIMSPERYLGAWRSVNDIQVQAGPERWALILAMIEERIAGMTEIIVPYKSRAYTARRANR